MKKEERKQRLGLTLLFALFVFIILFVSVLVAAAIVFILNRFGIIINTANPNLAQSIFLTCSICLAVGPIIAFFAVKIPLNPLEKVIDQLNALASGDYNARLHFGKSLGSHKSLEEMSISFNKLATELQRTEMLRADFINNFSHEFKTPIVSVAGFAKLLKRGNLTQEQQAEYLDIIEAESLRLSVMATNVLNLTKAENQTILTDLSTFNLSEQIRSAILLLENVWSRKNLDLQLNLAELNVCGNEELLRQVWINLLDNAVKFAPEGHTLHVTTTQKDHNIRVTISNTGSQIPPDKLDRIWSKFYQADESHSMQGNGVGLAIVKRIVDLHKGTVTVVSENDVTSFTVTLPSLQ